MVDCNGQRSFICFNGFIDMHVETSNMSAATFTSSIGKTNGSKPLKMYIPNCSNSHANILFHILLTEDTLQESFNTQSHDLHI